MPERPAPMITTSKCSEDIGGKPFLLPAPIVSRSAPAGCLIMRRNGFCGHVLVSGRSAEPAFFERSAGGRRRVVYFPGKSACRRVAAMKLEGRVALVTGAGSGIGRATAILFANEGAQVIVNDRDRETAGATVEAMGAARERGYAYQADVSDSAAVRAMFAELKRRFGALDVLVNNAGIGETGDRRDEINRTGEAQLQELLSGGPIKSHWDVTTSLSDEE